MATAKLRSPLLFIIPFYHFFLGADILFSKNLFTFGPLTDL